MKNSVIFWNVFYICVMIAVLFFSWELFGFIMAFNSLCMFGTLDGSLDEKHFSFFVNPLFLVVLFAGIIIYMGREIGKHTVVKFNNWLDNGRR